MASVCSAEGVEIHSWPEEDRANEQDPSQCEKGFGKIGRSSRTGLADVGESKEGRASHRETKHQRCHGEWVVGDRAVALGDEVAAPGHEHHKGKEPTGHGCEVNPKGPGHHGWPRRPVGPPNGSRLSCGRRARWRKAVEPQKKRLGGEATELFPTCERPPASSAC